MSFPILSLIIFIPLLAALLILALPAERKKAIRITALVAGALDLALAVGVRFRSGLGPGPCMALMRIVSAQLSALEGQGIPGLSALACAG